MALIKVDVQAALFGPHLTRKHISAQLISSVKEIFILEE